MGRGGSKAGQADARGQGRRQRAPATPVPLCRLDNYLRPLVRPLTTAGRAAKHRNYLPINAEYLSADISPSRSDGFVSFIWIIHPSP